MICDKIENLAHYGFMGTYIGEIVKYLSETDISLLPLGEHHINDGMFVGVDEYAPGEKDVYEAHHQYIDVQYLVSGDEEIDCVPIADCVLEKEYDSKIDAAFYKAAADAPVFKLCIQPGSFAIFEPSDCHRPGMKYRADKVRKLIFKVKVR